MPLLVLLTGCCIIKETPPAKLDLSNKFNLNLRLDGFEIMTLQQTGTYVGSGFGSSYNYRTGSYSSGSSVITAGKYEYRVDKNFTGEISDLFEMLGFNIKSDAPQLILEARLGQGHYPWDKGTLYYRDAPLNLICMLTMGVTVSLERVTDVQIIVYATNGKRLKEYFSEKSHYAFSIGFPFANFANPKAYNWYGDQASLKLAVVDCINQFTTDLREKAFSKELVSSDSILKNLDK